MRTAEEIIKERYPFYDENIQQKDVELNGEQVTELINKARKEAIIEAANRAKIKWNEIEYNEEKRDYDYEPEIDKQSILSLINELK